MIEAEVRNHGHPLSTRYTLLEKLGAGGQAEVWRARDESAGVEVALKVLSPSAAHDESAWAGLVREHAIASRLDHPLILKVQPPYRENNFAALPMELATGGDLRRLRAAQYLDVVPVLIDIAQALEYAHEQGVIHRDLKPSNVLFDARGRVRLTDFGIASAPGMPQSQTSRPGLSPFTASPEQLRGDPPAISDDIYGLGALAYELLSGYPPYYPRFEVRRVLEEPVPEIKAARLMPSQLAALVMRMLSKRPALRPHSMREVIDELDSTLNDTLTFDFDQLATTEDVSSTTAAMRRDAAVIAAAEAARATRELLSERPGSPASAANTATGPSGANSPGSATNRETTSARTASRAEQSAELAAGMAPRAPRTNAFPGEAPRPPESSWSGSAAAARAAAPAPDRYALTPDRPSPDPEHAFSRENDPSTDAIEVIPAEKVKVTDSRPVGSPVEAERIAAAAAAVRDAPGLGYIDDTAPRWDDLRLQAERAANRHRYGEPPRRSSWPWVLMSAMVAAAVVVFVVLPRYGTDISGFIGVPGETPAVATTPETAAGQVVDAVEAADEAATDPSAADRPAGSAAADRSSGEQTAAARSRSARASSTPVPAAGLEPPSAAPAGVRPAADDSATASSGDPQDRLEQKRASFDQRLAALESRGAGVWGGNDFATAKTRAAESVGAHDAGSLSLAEKRLDEALRLIGNIESRAGQTLAAQLAAGDRALAAGQGEIARQAYESASRIDAGNRRATEGLQRVRNLGGVLPLLADGANAEAEKDYARAVQDYSQALSLDPGNAKARAGLDRAHAAFGQDTYAKAVGTGFAALGAGRLEEARVAFEKARGIRPGGAEAQTGLQRVGAALSARGYAGTRQKAAALEAEERWAEALNEYDAALKVDPSLVFAQQGRARATQRSDLANSLQSLIDRPERLAAPAVRSEAEALLRRAAGADPSGPVLRSQIARLQILLPEFDVPVRLELVSDNATQVQIQRVGTFGTFSRRAIELKPGKYTVVGTRPGFRDVRRDVTIAPGRDVQTISVSCVEPI